MPFDIVLAPGAAESMRKLPAHVSSQVRDALERHLRHEPTKVSKSRIKRVKRLRGLSQPQYRLRVEEVRVFYDVTQTAVEVLAIVTKAEAQAWLEKEGKRETGGGTGQG
jgi:mRNA-degrading endonuclease RelE of RelBE toxin-antitoxin system